MRLCKPTILPSAVQASSSKKCVLRFRFSFATVFSRFSLCALRRTLGSMVGTVVGSLYSKVERVVVKNTVFRGEKYEHEKVETEGRRRCWVGGERDENRNYTKR